MRLMHRALALKPSGPIVRCLSALAEPQAREVHALRSRPARPVFVAVATVVGNSSRRATRGFPNHRGKAFPAQLASALARRRRQTLVSLWALPLSEGRCGLPGTVSSGSGVGSMQSVPRLPTVVTPNHSIEGTVKRLRLLPAPHVKR